MCLFVGPYLEIPMDSLLPHSSWANSGSNIQISLVVVGCLVRYLVGYLVGYLAGCSVKGIRKGVDPSCNPCPEI